jgi:hypothetical protein
MDWSLGRKWWITVALLGTILAVALLAFRLGHTPEEPTTETFTAEAVNLSMERPSDTIERFGQDVQKEWTQEENSIIVGIHVCSYREGSSDLPFMGHDGLTFITYVNASFGHGTIDSILIGFHLLEGNATVFLSENPWDPQLENATIVEIRNNGTNEKDAYVEAKPSSLSCSIQDQIYWVFLDENNEDHQMEIKAQVVHQNRTTRKITTVPIMLEMHLSTEGD